MDPQEIHDFEQNLAGLLDMMPTALFGFYSRLIKEGFSDEQAILFTLKWMEITFIKAK